MRYDLFSAEFQDAGRGAGVPQREVGVGAVTFRGCAGGGVGPGHGPQLRGIDIDDTAKDQSGPGFLPDVDSPRHDQLRKIVQPHFLPRRIAAQEDGIRAVVRGLVGSWRYRGEVDLAQELAWPMPFQVFFNLVGLPAAREEGREQLERWVHELKDREPDDPRLTPVAQAATAGVQDYFVQMLNERSRNPREDLVTHLVNAEIDGVPFAEEHIKPTSSHRIKRGSASLRRTDLRRGAQLDSRPLHE